MTRILFLGDIFSQAGRVLVKKRLTGLIGREELDLCLANGENAAGGIGLTAECAWELLGDGLDALSGGNHTFKYNEIEALLENDRRLIRPANYPAPCPGRGWTLLETAAGVKVGFGNVMGRTYMGTGLDCPFRTSERLLEEMGRAGAKITIIDFHAEATSEKIALTWHLDGRVGAVLGTHTHVQTADERIFPGGTAYITDVGMTGPHESVIGMRYQEAIASFMTGRIHRFKPAKNRPILQGVILDFDELGRATAITRLSLEGLP
ncbi:MAG: YmdB family metallophosphoesterase [Deltaproteobacteria bacterium]|jgi:metallophosphoesterase (TIGR00282 family)|nr:YmdB family metallophosphoesterase [Deltaproteobacteria bacterium]